MKISARRIAGVVMVAGVALMLGLLPGANHSMAQQGSEANQPQIRALPPAYEKQMLRLAEVLGSLHYLRELCQAGDGLSWHGEMETLLEKEKPDETAKARMIARFNRGFRSFREIYRECTPSAAEAANRYLRQGIRLSAEIPGRYGN